MENKWVVVKTNGREAEATEFTNRDEASTYLKAYWKEYLDDEIRGKSDLNRSQCFCDGTRGKVTWADGNVMNIHLVALTEKRELRSVRRKKTKKAGKKYGIHITYSWGDEEDSAAYGMFDTPEAAYEEACRLAGREAFVQNEEMEAGRDCQAEFFGYEKKIKLTYFCDGEECLYKVVELAEGN